MTALTFSSRRHAWFILPLLVAFVPASAPGQRSEVRAGTPASQSPSALSIRYELSMPRPTTHLFEATMVIENIAQPSIEVQFPVWVPGAYRVVDAARNVQELRASTPAGEPLPAPKLLTNTWRVETRGNSAARVSYKVYADQLTVSGIDLDDTHAYFNGALLFPRRVLAEKAV